MPGDASGMQRASPHPNSRPAMLTTDRDSLPLRLSDGASSSDSEEMPTTAALSPPPRAPTAIPPSASTIWARRWNSSVPAAGLFRGVVTPLEFKAETKPERLPPQTAGTRALSALCITLNSLLAAIPIALLSYATTTSYALLIVEGTSMEAELVVAMQLFGSALSGIPLPLCGGSKYTIASGDVSVAVFYGMWLSSVYRDHLVPDEDKHATAMMSIVVMTAGCSLLYMLMGYFRATDMVQYLPFPVVAGFLALVGSSIVRSAFVVNAGVPLGSFADLTAAAAAQPGGTAACLGLGVALVLARRLPIPKRVIMVSAISLSMLLFYASTLNLEVKTSELREQGWLFPKAAAVPFWSLWSEHQFGRVHWSRTVPALPDVVGTGVILIISLVLRISGVDEATGASIDLDRELLLTGGTNLVVGCLGGLMGSHSPGLVALNKESGPARALPGVLQALLLLAIWGSSYPLTNLLPRFLLGALVGASGVLLALGLTMSIEWIWVVPRTRLSWTSHLMVVAMVVGGLLYGMMPIIVAALLGTALMLVYRFSQLHVIKFHVSGRSVASIRRRPADEVAFLRRFGAAVHVVGLQGFLFEGTTVRLMRYLQLTLRQTPQEQQTGAAGAGGDADAPDAAGAADDADDADDAAAGAGWRRPRFLVLDLTQVHGLNETASALIGKFNRRCAECSPPVTLLFAAVGPRQQPLLRAHGALSCHKEDAPRLFRRTHDAMEYIETQLLLGRAPSERHAAPPNTPAEPARRSAWPAEALAPRPANGGLLSPPPPAICLRLAGRTRSEPVQLEGLAEAAHAEAPPPGPWAAAERHGLPGVAAAPPRATGRQPDELIEHDAAQPAPPPAHSRAAAAVVMHGRAPPPQQLAVLLPEVDDLEAVCAAGQWVRLREGQVLCAQGRVSSAVHVVAPATGAVLIDVDVGHVAGPVPVLHSGSHGAVVGATSVLGREACGYSCKALDGGVWVLRLSPDALEPAAEAAEAADGRHGGARPLPVGTLLKLQRALLLHEGHNVRRMHAMPRLWLAGGWSGANFDEVTAQSVLGLAAPRAPWQGTPPPESGGEQSPAGDRWGLARAVKRLQLLGMPEADGRHRPSVAFSARELGARHHALSPKRPAISRAMSSANLSGLAQQWWHSRRRSGELL